MHFGKVWNAAVRAVVAGCFICLCVPAEGKISFKKNKNEQPQCIKAANKESKKKRSVQYTDAFYTKQEETNQVNEDEPIFSTTNTKTEKQNKYRICACDPQHVPWPQSSALSCAYLCALERVADVVLPCELRNNKHTRKEKGRKCEPRGSNTTKAKKNSRQKDDRQTTTQTDELRYRLDSIRVTGTATGVAGAAAAVRCCCFGCASLAAGSFRPRCHRRHSNNNSGSSNDRVTQALSSGAARAALLPQPAA